MKFTQLYEKMEQELKGYRPGFQSQVGYTFPSHPMIKNQSDLIAKMNVYEAEVTQRLLAFCLTKIGKDRDTAIDMLDNIVGEVVAENKESLNDHHAAKPVFERLERMIKSLS